MESPAKQPKTLLEAVQIYADLDVATATFARVRWPEGPVCPKCGGKDHYYLKTRRTWKCKACQKQFSVKVGTVFEDSPIGLDKWLPAVWLLASARNGVSSYEIARSVGVTQKSAWFMMHRIRLAMRTGTFEKMGGVVEADETFVGGLEKFKHEKKRKQGRGIVGKTAVMGIVGRDGRARARVVPNTSKPTLQGGVRENVERGSTVMTDAAYAYRGLQGEYTHEFVDHAIEYVRGNVHTNRVENFWSLLKRTIKGTYVHVDPVHLSRYLDEQTFRFNNREGKDAERFQKALGNAAGRRLTYGELTGKTVSD